MAVRHLNDIYTQLPGYAVPKGEAGISAKL